MFSKLFSFFILIFIAYCMVVFLAPNFADTYGDEVINLQIRTIKQKLDNLGGSGSTPKSLIDSAKDIAKPYIKDTQETASGIKEVFDKKTKEIQKANESIQNAYTAVEKAKNDISKVTVFGTGTQK